MPATVLAASNRYNVRGTAKVFWIPRNATGRTAGGGANLPAGPLSAANIRALLGDPATIDVTREVIAINGFTSTTSDVPVPDMGSLKTFNIEGETTLESSSIDFYLSSAVPVNDIRTVLVTGQEGYLVLADNGTATGAVVDVPEVQVKFASKPREGVSRLMQPFSVEGLQENVALPA